MSMILVKDACEKVLDDVKYSSAAFKRRYG